MIASFRGKRAGLREFKDLSELIPNLQRIYNNRVTFLNCETDSLLYFIRLLIS